MTNSAPGPFARASFLYPFAALCTSLLRRHLRLISLAQAMCRFFERSLSVQGAWSPMGGSSPFLVNPEKGTKTKTHTGMKGLRAASKRQRHAFAAHFGDLYVLDWFRDMVLSLPEQLLPKHIPHTHISYFNTKDLLHSNM